MILCTLVTSQLHFEMCAGLYGHPVPCFTFNTKSMRNKTRYDVSVKQMFRTWMKTLLHCG